jgi:enoyl-CoA hydratase
MTDTPREHDDVILRVDGDIGRITLNRPRARNALTTDMVLRISNALDEWAADPGIRAVLVDGAGEHGLCAGGDVRAMRDSAIAADGEVAEFFRAEYRMNAQISHFPKPYVALMDGITMGGGIGISAHGSLRLVTERSVLAMPEVTIGIAPDVGASWLLAHAPGELGTYAALTGGALTAGDAIHLGLADHYLPSGRIDHVVCALPTKAIDDVVLESCGLPPASPLAARRGWIDECFAHDSVEVIVAALQQHESSDAHDAAQTILGKSPRALTVALAAQRRSRHLADLDAALEQEFHVSCNLISSHDAIEGIRALIVDKDRNPRWDPAELSAVTQASVDEAFAPGDHGTLGLRPPTA